MADAASTTRLVRALAARVTLAGVSVATTLLVLEVALRVAGHVQGLDYRLYLQEMTTAGVPAHIWAADGPPERAVWRAYQRYPPLRPGATEVMAKADFSVVYQINSRGLRDGEYDYERTPGKRRILALGDSFTFGSGIAYGERFVDVAERMLGDTEIIDMGVPGYGLDQALLGFVAEGFRYHPDAVVVFVNRYVLERHNTNIVTGDRVRIPDDVATLALTPRSPTTAYVRPDDPLLARSPGIVRASYLLSWVTYRIRLWDLRKGLVQDAERGRKSPLTGSFTVVRTDAALRTRTLALLRAFHERARAAGVGEFIVVNIDDAQRFPYIATIPGIVYHDLADELVALNQHAPIRFRYDPHYTAATHRYIGERLAALLPADLAAPAAGPHSRDDASVLASPTRAAK